MGGLFPYPLFDETNELQRNAAYHFVQHGRAFGNMYQVGSSVCAWYLGWMAAALAELGDTVEPARMLREAANGADASVRCLKSTRKRCVVVPGFHGLR